MAKKKEEEKIVLHTKPTISREAIYEPPGHGVPGAHKMLSVAGVSIGVEGATPEALLQDKFRVMRLLESVIRDSEHITGTILYTEVTDTVIARAMRDVMKCGEYYNIQRRILEFRAKCRMEPYDEGIQSAILADQLYPTKEFVEICKTAFELTDEDLEKYQLGTVFGEQVETYITDRDGKKVGIVHEVIKHFYDTEEDTTI